MSNLIDLKNPVFHSYVLWSSVLVLKMLAMSLLTAVQRFKNKVSLIFLLFLLYNNVVFNHHINQLKVLRMKKLSETYLLLDF